MFGAARAWRRPACGARPALRGHVLHGECLSPCRSQIWLRTPLQHLPMLPEEAPRGRGAPSLRSQRPMPASGTYLPYAEARPGLAAAAQTQWRPMRSAPARGGRKGSRG